MPSVLHLFLIDLMYINAPPSIEDIRKRFGEGMIKNAVLLTGEYLRFQHPGGGSCPGNGGQPEQPTGAAADRHYYAKL